MGSGLLLLGLTAYSQDRDRDRDEDRYHRVQRGEDWWRGRMFERVRDDLDHVQSVTFPFSADQYRLNKVKQELNELQAKLAENRYDQPELDDVISAMQRVVSDNHLSGRDRELLNDDLNRLRAFREHHDGYR
jgi:ABC-type transporter Mla subunit MlaD